MGRLVYVISFGTIVHFTWFAAFFLCLDIANYGESWSVVNHFAQLASVVVAGLYVFGIHKLCWWIKGGFEKNEK